MSRNFRVRIHFQSYLKSQLPDEMSGQAMTKVKKKISFEGQKIYVGIDVHKKQWTVCVCTDQTNFRPFSMKPDPELLISYLVREFPGGQYLCAVSVLPPTLYHLSSSRSHPLIRQ